MGEKATTNDLHFIELQAQMELINNVAQIGFWQFNVNDNYLEWNPAMFSIYGRQPEWFNHQFSDWSQCVHPDDLDMAEQEFRKCIDAGRNYVYSFRIITESGEIRHISASAMALKDDDGNTHKMVGVNQDVTAFKKLEEYQKQQSELLLTFIDQSFHSIAMFDKELKYIATSKKWISDYGITSDLIGKSHYEIFPEIGDDWKAIHQKCLNGGIDIASEEPFEREDGTIQYLNWDVRPWYDVNNEVGGLLMLTEDVTDRVKMRSEKEYLLSVLHETQGLAKIGAWEVDLVNEKIIWDEMTYAIHETNPNEFIPNLETAIHFYKEGESRETITREFNRAITEKVSYDLELQLVTYKGNEIWVRSIGFPVTDDKGNVIAQRGLFQDISAAKLNELSLVDAQNKLQVLANRLTIRNKSLSDFAHIASHNLRSPVGNIESLLGMLDEVDTEVEKEALINMIGQSSKSLQVTLNALIDSLIVKDGLQAFEEVEIDDVFKKTKEQFDGKIKKLNAKISFQGKGVHTILGSRIYLESIFLNLISNSLKYRKPNGAPVVEITARKEGGFKVIEFSDNGVGIDLERHGHKIFGLQKTFHRNKDAKGIGLFMVKSQMEAMGGTVFVKSEVMKGTTFTLRFN